ncbi:MAG: molybdenum cofactor guanylyltransferase [Cyclobacteriaceae bacterium]|nr:molybdenum cofactor guanylyltransferase [Cyclobacteriaceae bacterium]
MKGLILKGGKSSRMGQDKGLMKYHGTTQISHLYTLLSKYCDEIFVSVKKTDPNIKFKQIEDQYTFESPLNGIASAFKEHSNDCWLVVPCDMPEIDDNLLTYLINNRKEKTEFTGFYDSEGTLPEPLIGLWEEHSYSKVFDFIKKETSPRKLLKTLTTNLLVMPENHYHTNINTPEDARNFKKSLQKK